MSKAILVFDMPNDCYECRQLRQRTYDRFCNMTHRSVVDAKTKPDWCPLREMPKKDDNDGLYQLEYTQGYMSGWNACLDEILGE